MCAPFDAYVQKLEKLGCSYVPLTMDRNGTSPIAEMRLLLSMYRILKRCGPDYVFSYTIKNNIYAGLSCRFLGLSFVPNVTGLGPAFGTKGFLSKIIKLLYSVAFKNAPRVFFQNTSDLSVFERASIIESHKSKVLPGSGVDLKKFHLTTMPDCRSGVRFLMVSRLLKDKGVETFFEAAKSVRAVYPDTKFQLLGPLDEDSKNGVTRAELDVWLKDGQVEYLGNTQNVLPYLQDCHCVVLPTQYREGTPRALLEAASVGRALITTDSPGCRDVVIERLNGYLIPRKDAGQLAEACIDFVQLPYQKKVEAGEASRRHMEQFYDEKIVIESYMSLLDEKTKC